MYNPKWTQINNYLGSQTPPAIRMFYLLKNPKPKFICSFHILRPWNINHEVQMGFSHPDNDRSSWGFLVFLLPRSRESIQNAKYSSRWSKRRLSARSTTTLPQLILKVRWEFPGPEGHSLAWNVSHYWRVWCVLYLHPKLQRNSHRRYWRPHWSCIMLGIIPIWWNYSLGGWERS